MGLHSPLYLNEKCFVETSKKISKRTTAAENLLKLTGLMDAVIESVDDCDPNITLDFTNARTVLAAERERALAYLNGICLNDQDR